MHSFTKLKDGSTLDVKADKANYYKKSKNIKYYQNVEILNKDGIIKADIATNTAASPTRLWNPATNSGIAVIGILNAINAPMEPPINKNNNT